jgi:hypothetical protein
VVITGRRGARGGPNFVRGPVKVLMMEERVSYVNLSILEAGSRANSPKQTFPGTQNGAAEAEDGEDAEVSLRWRGTDQQIWSDDSSSTFVFP